MAEPFVPFDVYPQPGSDGLPPRVLVAPPKYVQGPGVLKNFGHYLKLYAYSRAGVLASPRGHSAQAGVVASAIEQEGTSVCVSVFGGECSLEEIDARSAELQAEEVECLIAVGGGKCVDAGKCIAYRLGVPVVIVPTLASNDAPCSGVSVLYTPDGVVSGAEFFPHNPVLVVVDTQEIANASERYFVAGIGDAMATWYEARVCAENPQAANVLGARPTLTANMIGELCARTLYTHGLDACAAVRENRVDQALEDVVEANTLLSGVGFESGGLAGAHAYAQGYTTLQHVEENYLHGEMVGMGVVAQLMLEQNPDEARRAAEFFAVIGLPITLEQIGVDREAETQIASVVKGAMTFAPLANFSFEVTEDKVRAAMLHGDDLGKDVVREKGDAAYRRLREGE